MDPSRLASLERSMRLLKSWHLVLSILLLISLGGNAIYVQASTDPPFRVYTATSEDAGAGGSSGFTADTINSTHTPESPLTLLSVTTSHLSNDHDHTCLVTASAHVGRLPTPSTSGVALGLSIGGDPRMIEVTERYAYFVTTSDLDVAVEEVTTTFAFTNVRRDETIRFSARWFVGETVVGTRSMTVVCLRHSI